MTRYGGAPQNVASPTNGGDSYAMNQARMAAAVKFGQRKFSLSPPKVGDGAPEFDAQHNMMVMTR